MNGNKKHLIIKYATQEEFDLIHKLNHAIFAEEIPQHEKRENHRLVDQFHEKNTYLIALSEEEIVGMICYNSERPFSLDRKLENLDQYLPQHQKMVEVRLFAVVPDKRKQGISITLLKTLISDLIAKGFDLGVISATTRELKLYNNMGATAFGPLVGTPEVPYQPMYFAMNNLKGLFKI